MALRFDNLVVDNFNPSGICCHTSRDEDDGGSNDLIAIVTHTNPVPGEIGTYTAEYQQPLDSSDDNHDFSLASDDIVGFKFTMGSPTGFDWPFGGPQGFADIIIATNEGPGQVTDPEGDARDDPNSDPDPDLVFGSIICTGNALQLAVRFVPDTFNPSTRAQFALDIDGNPLTGKPSITAGGIDSSQMGIEYAVSLGGNLGANARVLKFIAPPNSFATVGSFPATAQVDGYLCQRSPMMTGY